MLRQASAPKQRTSWIERSVKRRRVSRCASAVADEDVLCARVRTPVCVRVRACVCVSECARMRARVGVRVSVRVYVHACVPAHVSV